MTLIGIKNAAERMGVTITGARIALLRDGVPLTAIAGNAYAVDESDLAAYIAQRGGADAIRRGRPRCHGAGDSASGIGQPLDGAAGT